MTCGKKERERSEMMMRESEREGERGTNEEDKQNTDINYILHIQGTRSLREGVTVWTMRGIEVFSRLSILFLCLFFFSLHFLF